MIDELIFVNLSGDQFDFNTDTTPLHEFSMTVDVRGMNQERPQEHGIWPEYTWFGKRIFNLTGEILKDTSEQYNASRLALVKAILPRPTSKVEKKAGVLKIWLAGEAARMVADCTIDGYPELPMVAGAPARGNYQVNFKSFDPRLYSEALTTTNIAYGASATITNLGNVETWATITFNGPLTNPYAQVTRSWGSQILTYNGTLTAGQYVVVSTSERTAVNQAAANVYNSMSGDWWPIEAGAQSVTLGGTSGTGTLSVQHKSAWMI